MHVCRRGRQMSIRAPTLQVHVRSGPTAILVSTGPSRERLVSTPRRAPACSKDRHRPRPRFPSAPPRRAARTRHPFLHPASAPSTASRSTSVGEDDPADDVVDLKVGRRWSTPCGSCGPSLPRRVGWPSTRPASRSRPLIGVPSSAYERAAIGEFCLYIRVAAATRRSAAPSGLGDLWGGASSVPAHKIPGRPGVPRQHRRASPWHLRSDAAVVTALSPLGPDPPPTN